VEQLQSCLNAIVAIYCPAVLDMLEMDVSVYQELNGEKEAVLSWAEKSKSHLPNFGVDIHNHTRGTERTVNPNPDSNSNSNPNSNLTPTPTKGCIVAEGYQVGHYMTVESLKERLYSQGEPQTEPHCSALLTPTPTALQRTVNPNPNRTVGLSLALPVYMRLTCMGSTLKNEQYLMEVAPRFDSPYYHIWTA